MRFRPEIDYYEILQVHPRASPEMVKKAYRTLMGEMGAHPDLGGDEEQAKLINEAYTVLADAELRRAYDNARGARAPWGRPGGAPWWRPADAGPRGPGRPCDSFGPTGREMERLTWTVSKVLLSAVVIVAGLAVARLLRSPTLDLADLLAMVLFLLQIWRQVSPAGRV